MSSLDRLAAVIDWLPVDAALQDLHAAVKGEQAWAWGPLAMFKAMLVAVGYDLSEVKLAEALDDRASFRRFCGFLSSEATPERTAFVDPVFAGRIACLRTGLVFPQHRDDLLFRKSLPLYLSVLQSRPDSNFSWRKNSVEDHDGRALLPAKGREAKEPGE